LSLLHVAILKLSCYSPEVHLKPVIPHNDHRAGD